MKNVIDTAKAEIIGFEDLRYKFERDIILKGKTQKTYQCYILHIAHVSLYFKKLPTEISDEQIAEHHISAGMLINAMIADTFA